MGSCTSLHLCPWGDWQPLHWMDKVPHTPGFTHPTTCSRRLCLSREVPPLFSEKYCTCQPVADRNLTIPCKLLGRLVILIPLLALSEVILHTHTASPRCSFTEERQAKSLSIWNISIGPRVVRFLSSTGSLWSFAKETVSGNLHQKNGSHLLFGELPNKVEWVFWQHDFHTSGPCLPAGGPRRRRGEFAFPFQCMKYEKGVYTSWPVMAKPCNALRSVRCSVVCCIVASVEVCI